MDGGGPRFDCTYLFSLCPTRRLMKSPLWGRKFFLTSARMLQQWRGIASAF
jgi:hypothetical protein